MPQFMPGPNGQALNHGFLTRVRVAESNSLDSDHITMEAWINPRTFPGQGGRGAIFDNNGQYGLFLLPGGFLTCNGVHSIATNDPVVALNQWSAVACTADSEGMAIWVEGRKVAEGRGAALSKAGSSGTAVGSNLPDGDALDGLIDNVRLWKTIRNPRQFCAAARVCKTLL